MCHSPGYCITQPLLDLWQLTLARQAALAQASSTALPTLVRAQTANIEEARQEALVRSVRVVSYFLLAYCSSQVLA